MINIDQLKKEKSSKLILLDLAKSKKESRSVFELGSEAAALEGVLAGFYLKAGAAEKAVINLISQASCLSDARRYKEAFRIYNKALDFARIEETRIWIQAMLEKIDLPVEKKTAIIFQQVTANIKDNVKLRTPQKEAYSAACAYFKKGAGHAIIQLPVGCGKTGAISLMPFNISCGRVLVLAPNLEIRRNLYNNLNYHGERSFLRRFEVLKNGSGPSSAYLDDQANIYDCDDADILVTNIHQLAAHSAHKWLDKLSPDFFDMILIDEAHHNVASTWQNAIAKFPEAKIVSFTATPLRADGQKVEGDRIYRFPIAQAIKDGYVKDIASRRLEPQEIRFTYKGSDKTIMLEEVMKLREETWFSKGIALSRECNESIVNASIQCMNELRESGERHQIIAVACQIDHAKSIKSLYIERGYQAEVIHSKLEEDEQVEILGDLSKGKLDVIVQVQMLGEGADYPLLSVAAVFRPFRHLTPYIQFVGRIMRVIKQNAAGYPCNRGFVVSHVGLNVDRWWEELKTFDEDDEAFFAELALGEHEFVNKTSTSDEPQTRRRFNPSMNVVEERIVHFVEQGFLPEDAKLVVDDLIEAVKLRGVDLEELGLTRSDLEKKLLDTQDNYRKKGKIQKTDVSPQAARKAARKRLDERTRAGAKQLLNELKIRITGYDLPKLYPSLGTQANLPAAIMLLNKAVQEYLGVGEKERDILTLDLLKKAHDHMDDIIDKLADDIRERLK